MTIAYPNQAKELTELLDKDQIEKKEVGRLYFSDAANLPRMLTTLEANTALRSRCMLQILDEIGLPSLSNIGEKAAQAIAVLAVHDDFAVLNKILTAFNEIYRQDRNNCYYQSIPSMTDRWLLLQRKPQEFGTQWMFDADKKPFLLPVGDFEHVNERRKKYGIEPLRWPKSLAIPESEQPWLKEPLSSLTMRELTDEEYKEYIGK